MNLSRPASIYLANALCKVLEPRILAEKLALSLKPGSANRIHLLEDVNKTLHEIKDNKQPLPQQLETLKHYSEETEIKKIEIENETVESLCKKLILLLTAPEEKKELKPVVTTSENFSYLVNLPRGKKYFTAGEHVTQSGQKGPTCWYYAFGLIRPRVGKLDNMVPLSGDEKKAKPNITALIRMRKAEKIISAHRKKITQLTERQSVAEVMKYFPKLTISGANEFIKIIDELLKARSLSSPMREQEEKKIKENVFITTIEPYFDIFEQQESTLKSFKNFLTNYVTQTTHVKMSAYIRALEPSFVKAKIAIMEKTLKDLGRDVNRELAIQLGLPSMDKDYLPEEQLSIQLSDAIVRVSAEEYHLNKSTWNPSKGFDGLVAALKKEGALSISSTLGDAYYETPATFEKKSGDYEVYSWKPDAIRPPVDENGPLHEIVVVGTESIATASGDLKNTVLFVDPNDSSTTDRERKVYRVDYDEFCANIRSFSAASGGIKKEFWAYCANPTFSSLLQNQYKTLHEYHTQVESSSSTETPKRPGL